MAYMDGSDDSDGDGDHRIETLLREMRQDGDRWVLVKWQKFGHEEDTWEPKKVRCGPHPAPV